MKRENKGVQGAKWWAVGSMQEKGRKATTWAKKGQNGSAGVKRTWKDGRKIRKRG